MYTALFLTALYCVKFQMIFSIHFVEEKVTKDNNSRNTEVTVMVIVHCTFSSCPLSLCKFSFDFIHYC